MEIYVFWPAALLLLLTGLGVVMARNPVHSALLLIGNFLALAVLYILLEAHFLAAVQIFVYAGAVMVLFLFVIMLLGVDREESPDEPIRFQRVFAFLFVAALGAGLVLVIRNAFDIVPFRGLAEANAPGNVQGIGRALFSSYVFPLQITAVLLFVAGIGAVLLARQRLPGADDEDEAPPATPPGAPPEQPPRDPARPAEPGPPVLAEPPRFDRWGSDQGQGEGERR